MTDYYLHLAGLRILLRTTGEIQISESLRPFLSCKHEKIDCSIVLQENSILPNFSQGGVWHAAQYYDIIEETTRIFHCNGAGGGAFAVTELLPDGNINIRILPGYLSYFAGTSGIFNRIGMETMLLQHKGLLLHASLIKYREKAIAFAGPSGVGKSTQAALWQQYLNAEILNGDRAILRREENVWKAYGSPYAGTSGIYKNDNGPLVAIVLLAQGTENRLTQLAPVEAFRRIYPELSVHHWQKSFVAEATDLCLQLLEQIPVYLLSCRPEESAVMLVKKGLGL